MDKLYQCRECSRKCVFKVNRNKVQFKVLGFKCTKGLKKFLDNGDKLLEDKLYFSDSEDNKDYKDKKDYKDSKKYKDKKKKDKKDKKDKKEK